MSKNKIFSFILILILILGCSTNNDSNNDSNVIPTAPTNLSGQVISPTQINLTWTDNSTDEEGFKIERKTGTGVFQVIGETYEDTNNFSDDNLTTNTTYVYRVYYFNQNGNSPYSNEFTISTSFPILTTVNATSTSSSSASSGGVITSDGGAPISARGVVWDINPNPTIALSTKTSDGIGTGAFNSNITGLLTNTTYYVRAYATNSTGTSYGNNINFIINGPSISTNQFWIFRGDYWNSFPLYKTGGTITSDGGVPITARGIVWSTSPNPTIALSTKTTNGTGIGTFDSYATGLISNPATTYYIRAYATNSNGTFYGDEIARTTILFFPTNTPGSNVTDIDGNVYQTVSNCYQTWTKSNLNVTRYRNGDVIPQGDYTQISNATTGFWYYYDNDPANGAIYGKLYNWYAVNDPRGLAPAGFHIASAGEWNTFLACMSDLDGGNSYMSTVARVKEAGFSHWSAGGTSGNNLSGFTALPMKNNGTFSKFWTSTSGCTSTPTPPCSSAVSYEITESYAGEQQNYNSTSYSLKKVRCIKD
jgi:uncharacterized protein (TIGR02145 family)